MQYERYNRTLIMGISMVASVLLYQIICQYVCPSTLNQFNIGNIILHLHHWILSLVALLILMFIPGLRDSAIIAGLFLGGIFHGLTYSDWYIIIRPID